MYRIQKFGATAIVQSNASRMKRSQSRRSGVVTVAQVASSDLVLPSSVGTLSDRSSARRTTAGSRSCNHTVSPYYDTHFLKISPSVSCHTLLTLPLLFAALLEPLTNS